MVTTMTIDISKNRFECKHASIEELDKLLRDNYRRLHNRDSERLLSYIYETELVSIDWQKLQHVRLFCKSNENIAHSIAKEFPSGFYLNADGTWFLAALSNVAQLQDIINSCCANVISLWFYSSSISSVDVHRLPALKELRLVDHPELVSIEHLGTLTGLEDLTVARCPKLLSFPELENLTNLIQLTITHTVSFRGESLNNSPRKHVPILSQCSKLTSLPGLEKLTNLTYLNLFGCCSLTALPGLEQLKQLSYLNLSLCFSLEKLPRLGTLPNLTHLDLSECRKIKKLTELEKLTQLTHLDLSMCDQIYALPGLEELTNLTHLDLSECNSLTSLPALEHLTRLTSLSLDGCKNLKILPEWIRTAKSLRRLDLNSMQFQELPDWLPEIAEAFYTDSHHHGLGNTGAFVYLHDTTVEGIDMSIFDQPYELVVEWFKNRTKIPLNEIKVVFLGDGEAGKSHTIARLLNNGGEPSPQTFDGKSTPGIVISNKEYDLGNRKIQIHYWDFGGQEIMHSMHRIFLTGRTMYVILLNARDDTQSDRAKYWLHNVKSFAPNAPVLLVLNKIDQNENASVDENDLRGRYERLTQVVKLSAKEFPKEQFNKCFTDILLNEINNTGFLDAQWPVPWTQVKQKLENMDSHYIMGDAYQRICKEYHVDDNQKNLLHWFNDLGISFCCCDKNDYALEDHVILRPDWITNALYIILFNKLEGVQNGLIPHASIHRVLKTADVDSSIRCTLPDAKYTTADIQYVLGVMRKFNLSFQHGTDYEFIPMLCKQNSTVDIQYYHKDEDILEFNMEFDYLPNNLLHQLMVERNQELDMDNVWRTGARFQLHGTELSAVVTVDDRVLHIFIRNDGNMHLPNTYLAMLKANVDKIVKKMGIKAPECKLVYKVQGKRATFSYDRLLKMHTRGHTEEYCEALDEDFRIEDILNQAAPAASEDLNTLLDSTISAGLHLQGNKNYRGWDENGRNSVIRDSLGDIGYIVLDQSLRGTSSTGKSYGELDLLIERKPNHPWVLCEALIVNGYTHKWNEHLDKLLNEYNPHGLSTLFLLTYVDCAKSKFDTIWTKYIKHIRDDNPQNFLCMSEKVSLDLYSEYEYIKIARCCYQRDSYVPTVYHIFVQMDPKSKD